MALNAFDDLSAGQTLRSDAGTRGFKTLIMPNLLDGSFRIACTFLISVLRNNTDGFL